MMLVVMDLHRQLIDMRLERVGRVIERRQSERVGYRLLEVSGGCVSARGRWVARAVSLGKSQRSQRSG